MTTVMLHSVASTVPVRLPLLRCRGIGSRSWPSRCSRWVNVSVSTSDARCLHTTGSPHNNNATHAKQSPAASSTQQPVRVRFAPSPTGALHIGGLRTALYNYLLAHKASKSQHAASDASNTHNNSSSVICRIEDTDQKRYVPEAAQQLTELLTWAGIDFDESPYVSNERTAKYGPYVQSQRLAIYKQHVDQLVASNHAYPCFCSSQRLAEVRDRAATKGVATHYDRTCASLTKEQQQQKMQEHQQQNKPYVIRLRCPQQGTTEVRDLVRGRVRFLNKTLDDQILLKSDGYPTYHLAVVVDDHLMDVTHVIRGEEWLASTPKHLLLYKFFGWKPPQYAHLPLLLNADGSKLSKRNKDQIETSVQHYKDAGYLPSALINFIALLGWNSGEKADLYYEMQQLVDVFDLKRVHKAGAVVNPKKLNSINQQHIRKLLTDDETALTATLAPKFAATYADSEVAKSPEYVQRVIACLKEHVYTLNDFIDQSAYFFATPDYTTAAAQEMHREIHSDANLNTDGQQSRRMLKYLMEQLQTDIATDSHSAEYHRTMLQQTCESLNISNKQLFMLLRYVLTGNHTGPYLHDVMATLGKDLVVKRMQRFVEH